MITLTKIKDATSEFIKILRFGKSDVLTASQANPFGIDSKPIDGMTGVHSDTSNQDKTVVLGYLLESTLTDKGEIRVYSTNTAGTEKFFIYLKNDGTCEINGNTDNFIKYTPLNTGLQNFIIDLNTKLAAAFTGVGGSWPGTTLDISGSKIDEIKTG